MTNQFPQVSSRSEFIAFLAQFRRDLEERSDEWENLTLPHFLEAMGAWVEDAEIDSTAEAWKLLRDCLRAGRAYE
jgi:hypothetical protein